MRIILLDRKSFPVDQVSISGSESYVSGVCISISERKLPLTIAVSLSPSTHSSGPTSNILAHDEIKHNDGKHSLVRTRRSVDRSWSEARVLNLEDSKTTT
jgi:hypothetical protein